MNQNTNVITDRTKEQIALLSDEQAEQIAEMAKNLDLHSAEGQRKLHQLASTSSVPDGALTAWLVEYGDVRMVNIIPAIRLSGRNGVTGELSPSQRKTNLAISLANAHRWSPEVVTTTPAPSAMMS